MTKKKYNIKIGNKDLTTEELHKEIQSNSDKVRNTVRGKDGTPIEKECTDECTSCQL